MNISLLNRPFRKQFDLQLNLNEVMILSLFSLSKEEGFTRFSDTLPKSNVIYGHDILIKGGSFIQTSFRVRICSVFFHTQPWKRWTVIPRDEQHSIASGRDYASVALFKRYDSFLVRHRPFRHNLEIIELLSNYLESKNFLGRFTDDYQHLARGPSGRGKFGGTIMVGLIRV